jgi:hypothetical protein
MQFFCLQHTVLPVQGVLVPRLDRVDPADVARVRLPVGNLLADLRAAVEVLRVRVGAVEGRNLQWRGHLVVVACDKPVRSIIFSDSGSHRRKRRETGLDREEGGARRTGGRCTSEIAHECGHIRGPVT